MARVPGIGQAGITTALAAAVLCVAVLMPGSGVCAEEVVVGPPDVFMAVRRIHATLDPIGRYLGLPRPSPLGMGVTKIAPHDVYFQALILASKVNELSFEIVREIKADPSLHESFVAPREVLERVLDAQAGLDGIANEFNLEIRLPDPARDDAVTPSQVFLAIQAENRYLNILLDRPSVMTQAYRTLSRGVGYCSLELARYPGARRIPEEPAFAANKSFRDVFYRIDDMLETLSAVFARAGLEMFGLDLSTVDPSAIAPGDVLDLAALAVARLDYLHWQRGGTKKPREIFYPGRKVPADVYQMADLLDRQLHELLALMPPGDGPEEAVRRERDHPGR